MFRSRSSPESGLSHKIGYPLKELPLKLTGCLFFNLFREPLFGDKIESVFVVLAELILPVKVTNTK